MPGVKDYLAGADDLPAAPHALPHLLVLLNQPNVNLTKLAELITCDPALAERLLLQCNSAYFGAALPATDVTEAINRLGFRQVYQLVAALSGSRALQQPQYGFGMETGELWQHSITAAVAAQIVACRAGENESQVFTAALLHDIGKIVLTRPLERLGDKFSCAVEDQSLSRCEVERRLLGVDHAEVGGGLLARWQFPIHITAAVRRHHDPILAGPYERFAALVHLGNTLAHMLGHSSGCSTLKFEAHKEVFGLLKLSPSELPQFLLKTFERMDLIEALVRAGLDEKG